MKNRKYAYGALAAAGLFVIILLSATATKNASVEKIQYADALAKKIEQKESDLAMLKDVKKKFQKAVNEVAEDEFRNADPKMRRRILSLRILQNDLLLEYGAEKFPLEEVKRLVANRIALEKARYAVDDEIQAEREKARDKRIAEAKLKAERAKEKNYKAYLKTLPSPAEEAEALAKDVEKLKKAPKDPKVARLEAEVENLKLQNKYLRDLVRSMTRADVIEKKPETSFFTDMAREKAPCAKEEQAELPGNVSVILKAPGDELSPEETQKLMESFFKK